MVFTTKSATIQTAEESTFDRMVFLTWLQFASNNTSYSLDTEIPIPLECNPVLSKLERETTSIGRHELEGVEAYVGDITQQDMEQFEEEDWTDPLEVGDCISPEAVFQFGDVSLEEIEQFEEVDSDVKCDEGLQLDASLDKTDNAVEGSRESDRTVERLRSPSLGDDDTKVDKLLVEALEDYETRLSPINLDIR